MLCFVLRIGPALILAFTAHNAGSAPLGLPSLPPEVQEQLTPARIALGEKLFHDARLSRTGEVACHSCHLDAIAFHDGRRVSRGVYKAQGTRNAPTVLNAAFAGTLFWDGRVGSLEEQALHPLTNPVEHGLADLGEVLSIVLADPAYVQMLDDAFGVNKAEITIEHVASAIASYERTLIFGDSPFDRWHFGGVDSAMSAAAKRGFELFQGRAGCASCHTLEKDYALFADDKFHNVNVGFARLTPAAIETARAAMPVTPAELDHLALTDEQLSELGRFAISGQEADIGAFRTPSLRNVARTAPYMHDGSLLTLLDVVRYFNNGGRSSGMADQANPYQSEQIRPLGLNEQEEQDLVAFLESLTSPAFAVWYR